MVYNKPDHVTLAANRAVREVGSSHALRRVLLKNALLCSAALECVKLKVLKSLFLPFVLKHLCFCVSAFTETTSVLSLSLLILRWLPLPQLPGEVFRLFHVTHLLSVASNSWTVFYADKYFCVVLVSILHYFIASVQLYSSACPPQNYFLVGTQRHSLFLVQF